MRILVIAFLSLLVLPSLAVAEKSLVKEKKLDPENTLYMDLKDGRVVIEMFPAFAPKTVERIKLLTRQGFYDGSPFHRVIDGFMVQTGDPDGDGIGGSDLPDLEDEFNIKRHWRGVASMANTGQPNSANSQFFIMLQDNSQLDGHYTVWGRVVEGMRFVDNIKKGDEMLDGKVENPDRILRMRVAADVDEGATPTAIIADIPGTGIESN